MSWLIKPERPYLIVSCLLLGVLWLSACTASPTSAPLLLPSSPTITQVETPTPPLTSTPSIPTYTPMPPTPTYLPLHTPEANFPKTRDILQWPFSAESIWNMPIGSEAVYVPAKILPAGGAGLTVDEDILIFTPNEPLMEVYFNHAGWSGNNRCEKEGELVGKFPIPADFLLPHPAHTTPNNSTAILLPDGRTVAQNQPFHHCEGLPYATTGYVFPNVDLFGDGIPGAHGGSGLSSIGGTLRLGELTPGNVIHHTLKVNLFGYQNLFYASDDPDGKPGYRWPAVTADGYAGDPDSPIRYRGKNPALQMGALLALHPSVDLSSVEKNSLGLETDAALILARAFQDYGAYVVDDTAWDVYALEVEYSPNGSVADEFEKTWGFSMTPPTVYTPWGRDIQRIFTNLFVIDNNTPESISRGGTRRAPLAPPARKLRIMPLGDSLTEGDFPGPVASYRGYLEGMLRGAGYDFEYIGTNTRPAHNGSDPHSEGHSGYTVGPDESSFCPGCPKANLYDNLEEYMQTSPDIILLLIGINDMFPMEQRPVKPADAPGKLEGLVKRIQALQPGAKILLASLAPVEWTDGHDWPEYAAVNDMAEKLGNADAKDTIYFVDMNRKLEALFDKKSDYTDGLHWNEKGARKVAQVWYDALLASGVIGR